MYLNVNLEKKEKLEIQVILVFHKLNAFHLDTQLSMPLLHYINMYLLHGYLYIYIYIYMVWSIYIRYIVIYTNTLSSENIFHMNNISRNIYNSLLSSMGKKIDYQLPCESWTP